MATLTLRTVKGSALTNAELDANFQNIINAIGASSTTIPTPSGTGSPVLNTAPTIAGGSITGLSTLAVRDTSAAFDVTLAATSSTVLTAGRTITFDVVNAARTVKLGGNLSLAGNLTTANAVTFAGNFTQTITATANTSVTLPVSGTLSTLDGVETLTNKTISTGSTWSGNTIAINKGGTGSTSTQYCSLTTNVTGILPIGNGGTGSSATQYCSLSANVTGTLPTANGGTGLTSFTSGGAVYATSTSILTTGTLPISAGGTGAVTQQNAINALVGSVGTAGYVLRSNGTNVSMAAIQASDIPTLNQNTTGNASTATLATTATNLASGAAGSLPYQSAAGTTAMLAAGTQGKALVMGASAPTWDSVLTNASTVSTSSGTIIDFASIPSWVKRITIAFKDVNLSGSDDILIQLGNGGTPVATGYVSTSVSINNANGSAGTSNTTGLLVFHNSTSYIISGIATLINAGGNLWVYSMHCKNGTSNVGIAGGHIQLAGALDIVRIKPTGTNTFSGTGSITLLYE